MRETRDIATTGSFQLPAIEDPEQFFSELAEDMDGINPALLIERVKVPAGGGIAWEITDADGNADTAKEITGIIIDSHRANAMWHDELTGEGKSPDCQSSDGKTGSLYGLCDQCQYNEFGTGRNGGKLCKNTVQVFILPEGRLFPVMVSVPATSIKSWNTYKASRLLAKGKKPHQVITKLTLTKEQNKDGITYSTVTFAIAGTLDKGTSDAVSAYAQQLRPLTRGAGATIEPGAAVDVTLPNDDDEGRF